MRPIGVSVRRRLAWACALVALAGVSSAAFVPQAKREFTVTAFKYGYRVSGSAKAEIRVAKGDLVKITFEAEDAPHSFTIKDQPANNYRIMRRAEPGKPATIDFRADQAGQFEFFCNLAADERCPRETVGRLIVEEK